MCIRDRAESVIQTVDTHTHTHTHTHTQVKERTKTDPTQLEHLVKKLLIVINRMARLLEIMVCFTMHDVDIYV